MPNLYSATLNGTKQPDKENARNEKRHKKYKTNLGIFLDSPTFVFNMREYLGRQTVLADVDILTFVILSSVDAARVVYNTVLEYPGVRRCWISSLTT